MKITISQLRRIIKEETQNVITESSKLTEIKFNNLERSELWQNTAYDDDPVYAQKNVRTIADTAAAILGVGVGSIVCA